MPDPAVAQPHESEFHRYYQGGHPPAEGWPSYHKQRSPEQVQQDVNRAHDNIKKLIRADDGLRYELSDLRGRLNQCSSLLTILWFLFAGESALLLALLWLALKRP